MTADILSPETSPILSPEESSPCIVSGPLPDKVLAHFMVRRPPTPRTSSPHSVGDRHSNSTSEPAIRQLPSLITPLSVPAAMARLPLTPEQSPVDESIPEDVVMDEARNKSLEVNPWCEFCAECVSGSWNARKCISHFFGRNKTCTRTFPDDVWVLYCRKHYQRARYRADSWPFKQCDIFQETLNRMQAWDGVSSFRLTLRKREHIRTPSTGTDDTSAASASLGINRTRQSTQGPRRTKRSPNASAPVPSWLRDEVGDNKSFDEIRDIIKRIREYIQAEQEANNYVAFPDIEILPTFKPEFVDELADDNDSSDKPSKKSTRRTNANTRVSRRGAVKKVGAKASAGWKH
ncbi:hypothetical protein VTN96DRAFT_2189 [Rasamsonia emersonii]